MRASITTSPIAGKETAMSRQRPHTSPTTLASVTIKPHSRGTQSSPSYLNSVDFLTRKITLAVTIELPIGGDMAG